MIHIPLDPEGEYIHLARDGTGQVVPGGGAFWSLAADEMARFDDGWLVSEFTFSENWNCWEVHPAGDELVYLLSGEIELLLQLPSGTTATHISERGAILVPWVSGIPHESYVRAVCCSSLVVPEPSTNRPAGPNRCIEPTAHQRCWWVPSALRAPAAAHAQRSASCPV